jgi:hypothetical protein
MSFLLAEFLKGVQVSPTIGLARADKAKFF